MRHARQAPWPVPRPSRRYRPGTAQAAAVGSPADRPDLRYAASGHPVAVARASRRITVPASPTVPSASRRRRAMSVKRGKRGGIHVAARHRRRTFRQKLCEQAQFRCPVGRFRSVIIQVVPRQIGKRRGGKTNAVQPELVEAMRRRLDRRMLNADARKLRQAIGQNRPDPVWSNPVRRRNPGAIRPRVPKLAAGLRPVDQIWRRNSTVLVLPLVPVTATTTSGCGPANPAASCARRRRGSRSSNNGRAGTPAGHTVPSGASTAAAPRDTASAMKSRPSPRLPGSAANR